MKVRLVSKTEIDKDYLKEVIAEEFPELVEVLKDNIEALLIYCARVTSSDQGNPSYEKLLKHCLTKKHWSVFSMADITFEIYTSRLIAAQIRTHTSFQFDSQEDEFVFQEFSQRYRQAPESYEYFAAYTQSQNNRQASKEKCDPDTSNWWMNLQAENFHASYKIYEEALAKGISKEIARAVLPLQTTTRLFMKGSIRSWIHYLEARDNLDAQIQHTQVAQAIKDCLIRRLPTITKSCLWHAQS